MKRADSSTEEALERGARPGFALFLIFSKYLFLAAFET